MAYVTPGTVAAGDVATAAAWNVLTNDVIDHESRINTAGLTWISTTTITATNASPQTITNCFSASYDNYRLVFKGLTATTAGNAILFRLGTNVITASYFWIKNGLSTGNAANTASAQNDTSWALSFISSTVAGASLELDIISPFLTDFTHMTGTGFGGYTTAGVYFGHALNGLFANTGSHTGFTLLPSVASTTMGGSVSVYGYHI